MKKLLEIEFYDEIKKNYILVGFFSFLVMALFFITRIEEKEVFTIGFIIEFTFLIIILRFYGRALKNRNYAFWGLTAILGIYLLMNILQYSFIHYNVPVLYISLLASVFLGMNVYILSSPLYFPRIQWWEYDFRYRGDIKAKLIIAEESYDIRVADIRRDAISFFSFKQMRLNEEIHLEVPFGTKNFAVIGVLKTAREEIPGRPIRYGLKLIMNDDISRKKYIELRKYWGQQSRANIRRKFRDFQENKNK